MSVKTVLLNEVLEDKLRDPEFRQAYEKLRTEADYGAAVDRLALLVDDDSVTPDDKDLLALLAAIEEYETEHYPIGEPTWWGRLWFRFEQKWLSRLWKKEP